LVAAQLRKIITVRSESSNTVVVEVLYVPLKRRVREETDRLHDLSRRRVLFLSRSLSPLAGLGFFIFFFRRFKKKKIAILVAWSMTNTIAQPLFFFPLKIIAENRKGDKGGGKERGEWLPNDA
jgi:hypothetical protein